MFHMLSCFNLNVLQRPVESSAQSRRSGFKPIRQESASNNRRSLAIEPNQNDDILITGPIKLSDTAKVAATVTGKACVRKGPVGERAMKTTGQSTPQEFV
jgi:hypothetical protein